MREKKKRKKKSSTFISSHPIYLHFPTRRKQQEAAKYNIAIIIKRKAEEFRGLEIPTHLLSTPQLIEGDEGPIIIIIPFPHKIRSRRQAREAEDVIRPVVSLCCHPHPHPQLHSYAGG